MSQAARRLVAPLGFYLAGTLLVPLANGAGSDLQFWEHAVVVLLTAAPLTVAAAFALRLTRS
jgi:hypothetical protein